LMDKQARLAPTRIGSDGRIMEWLEEYKEPEEYVPTAQEQIDEMSYMGMLADEEPPLQIAESPPEPPNDETSTALKSISDELSEKSEIIREKSDSNEELLTKVLANNDIKTDRK